MTIWDVREAQRKGNIDGPGYSMKKLYTLALGWPWYYTKLGGFDDRRLR